jgi:hypothetical protein
MIMVTTNPQDGKRHPVPTAADEQAMRSAGVPLGGIRTDGTQTRAGLNEEAVQDYADAYKAGEELPPVVLFSDATDLWLADGFHRLEAAKRAGLLTIPAVVKEGTQRDALFHSAGANATHGLRRTNADKERAVLMLLHDEEWRQASNRWIAEHCKVSDHTVARVREAMEAAEKYDADQVVDNGHSGGTSARRAQTRTSNNQASGTSETRADRAGRRQPAHKPRKERRRFWFDFLGDDTKAILGDHKATFFKEPMKRLASLRGEARTQAAMRLAASGATTVKQALAVIDCENCWRKGAPTCDACREAFPRGFPRREPGDDTESEAAAKAKDRADRKANGKPGFDDPKGEIKDAIGAVVPGHLRDVFADTQLAEMVATLEGIQAQFRPEPWVEKAGKLCDHHGFILIEKFREHLYDGLARIQLATEALIAGLPCAVCPSCNGVNSKKDGETCRGCRGFGAVPKHRYEELTGA